MNCRTENGIVVCDNGCYIQRLVEDWKENIQENIQRLRDLRDLIEEEENVDLHEINKKIELYRRIILRITGSHDRIYLNKFSGSQETLHLVDLPDTEPSSAKGTSSTSSSSLPQEPLAALSDLMADLILTSDTEKLNTERLTKIALANQKMLICLLEFQQLQNAGEDLSSESFSILSNHLYSLLVEIFDDSTSGM